MSIQYHLLKTNLPAVAGKFTAAVNSQGTVGIDELAVNVADTNLASADEVKAIISATCGKIQQHLLEGRRIQLGGIVTIGTSIKGTFETSDAPFDPDVNSIDVTATAGSRIRKAIAAEAIAEKADKPQPSPKVMQYKDVVSDTYDSVITNGGLGQLNGVDLDFDTEDSDQGLYIADAVPGPTPETKVTVLQKHTAKQIVFMVPDISLYTDVILVIRKRNSPTGPIVSGQSPELTKQ